MFESQTNELDFDDDETPEKDDYFEKNNAYEFSMKLPVKTHIFKIEDTIRDVQGNLEISSKNLDSLKSQLKDFEKQKKVDLEEFSRGFYPEISRLSREVRKIMELENQELGVLKKQAHQLAQERIKLQNDTLVLENKVVETDKDLGFKYKIDVKKGNKYL